MAELKQKIAQTEASLRDHPYTDWITRHDKITELKEQLKQKNMNTATLSKPANELSAAELKALLADRESEEQNQRIQKRKDYEVLRDSTVNELVGGAMHFNGVLKGFKTNAYNDLEAMYKLLQEHSSRHEKGKGTFTIENSESTMKVQFKRHDATMFDERATQAEKYILEFLTDEFGDDSESDPRNKLIKKLLERKKGKVDKDNVLLLAGMKDDFPNANWHKGIDLYLESIVPAHTKYYAQFYYRDSVDDAWLSIVLDFAKL